MQPMEEVTGYDDDRVLTLFVLGNYRHLLAPEEERVLRVILGYGTHYPETAEGRWMSLSFVYGRPWSDEFEESTKDGEEVFLRRIRDRLLRDHPEEVRVARCPRGEAVLRSLRAQQCLRCGLDLHHADPQTRT